MEQTTQAPAKTVHGSIVHVAVVLVLETFDPLLNNPDYLTRKGIVSRSYREAFVNEGPARVSVSFGGGVTVTAERQRLQVEREYDTTDTGQVDVPSVARRYLESLDGVHVKAVGINPAVFQKATDIPGAGGVDRIRRLGDRLTRDGVVPSVELTATYLLENRQVKLTVRNETRHGTGGVLFHANVHRELSGENSEERRNKAAGFLASWERSLADLHACIDKFEAWEKEQ